VELTVSRILVVDDDPQILKYCSTVLEDSGYSVTGTTSGAKATRLLQEAAYDLLILDLNIPDRDGFEILETVRSPGPMQNIKILAISGFMQGTLLKAAELVGADATLDKPSSPEKLLAAVKELLAQPDVHKAAKY
jgi:CheY-like chemotaxis protein